LFELGTHRIAHIPQCSVQHPLINRVASVTRHALIDAQVASYSEAAHAGVARYLQVVIERSSQRAQVVLVANAPHAAPLRECFARMQAELGDALHSLWFNSQCEPTNTILGEHFEHIAGAPTVLEQFGGAAVHYPPGAFGQSNLEIAARIVSYVRDNVPQGSRVTEFYAGVGAIGLSLIDRVADLRLNEVSPHSLHGLAQGLAGLTPAMRARATVVPGAAGAAADAARDADVVIVDPPRKGLDPELVLALASQPPARLIYVSCGLESLLADTERLTRNGLLRLTALRAFNLLPFTEHVETVACYERA
jgi:23S rRNA (uracil1939-C5)-methyltransferase